jgi:hypothetical protein
VKNNMNNISDDVLAKYVLGEASGTEKNRVEEWLKQSVANKKYYEQFRQIWSESSKLAIATNVNEDEAWQHFKERTAQYKAPGSGSFNWVKIAAILVLLAGAAWLTYTTLQHKEQTIVNTKKLMAPLPVASKVIEAQTKTKEIVETSKPAVEKREDCKKKDSKATAVGSSTRLATENNMTGLYSYYKKKKIVCNGTACPIEICIVQSAKCKDREDAEISTCNTLEPDESGQLRYKTYDKTLANCTLTIEEIRITRLSTGETIVLNDSTPVKAIDLFNYMTGKKKGDIVAGIFHTDCNNDNHSHDLTFDNKLGDLLLK